MTSDRQTLAVESYNKKVLKMHLEPSIPWHTTSGLPDPFSLALKSSYAKETKKNNYCNIGREGILLLNLGWLVR